jgi:hypothetical protein
MDPRLGFQCHNDVFNSNDHCRAGHVNKIRQPLVENLGESDSVKVVDPVVKGKLISSTVETLIGPAYASLLADNGLLAKFGKLPSGEDTYILGTARELRKESKQYLIELADGGSPQIPNGPYGDLLQRRMITGKQGEEVVTHEGQIAARGLQMFPHSHTLQVQ